MKYWKGDKIKTLESNQIFVFGSNVRGIHGAGSAKVAASLFGAKYGKGRGLEGQSYALITKNLEGNENFFEKETGIVYNKSGYRSLTEKQIIDNITELYKVAKENPNLEFFIAYTFDTCPNGTPKKGLNGYNSQEMYDMFLSVDVPENIVFHESYQKRMEMNNKLSNKNQGKF